MNKKMTIEEFAIVAMAEELCLLFQQSKQLSVMARRRMMKRKGGCNGKNWLSLSKIIMEEDLIQQFGLIDGLVAWGQGVRCCLQKREREREREERRKQEMLI
jgi:hypothetical protein